MASDEMSSRFCYLVKNPELHYLEIQQDFVINHGRYLPSYVLLKVALSDKLFEVKVVRLGGELFLMKGWEEFKEHYSVKYGDFLTFEFDGDSMFQVFIFDRTCTHIECPFREEETDSDSDSDSDDGFEILPKSERKRLARVAREEEKRTRKGSKSEGKRLASVAREEEERMRMRKRSKTDTVLRKSADFRKGKTSRMVNIASDGSENSSEDGSENSSEDENRFNNNLEDGTSQSFTKKVKIYQAHRLKLPQKFAKSTHISAPSKIILKAVNGSTQEVNVIGRASDRYAFGSGWYVFLKKNRITVGSTLSFKFVSSASKIIEVRVEKRVTDEKKLFEYVMKRKGRYEIISGDHSRKNPGDHTKNSKGKDVVTNQEGGSRTRTKPVKLSSDHTKNSKGKDVVTNQEGGSHTRTKPVKLSNDHTKNSKGKDVVSSQEGGSHTCTKPVKHSNTQELGNRNTGETWAFSVKLKYHHTNKLDIPMKFVNGTGLARKNEILLKVGSDGEWPVRVMRYRCSTYSMTTGWRDFLRDNKLFEGNEITFKFVQDSDDWIDVRVSKNGEKGKPLFTFQRLGRPLGSKNVIRKSVGV